MINNIRTITEIFKELNYILDRKQKNKSVFIIIVIIISSLMELLGVSVILPFMQAIINPDKLMNNCFFAFFYNYFGFSNEDTLIIFVGLSIIVIYLFKNAFSIWASFIEADFSTELQASLSVRLFKSYMIRPYAFFVKKNSAEVIRDCDYNVYSCYSITLQMFKIIAELITDSFIVIYLIYLDWVIAVSVILMMAVIMIGIVMFFRPRIKKVARENGQLLILKNKIITQAIQGIKEVIVMQRNQLFIDKYIKVAKRSREVYRTNEVASRCPDRIVEGLFVSGIIGFLCFRMSGDPVSVGDYIPKLATFAMAAMKIMPSVGKISSSINTVVFNRPLEHQVYVNLKETDDYKIKHKEFDENYSDNYIIENNEEEFELKLSNIKWTYENTVKPVLTNMNMVIKKGDSIGIIGPSGAGKTTTVDILLGLLTPKEGSITYNGIPIERIKKQWSNLIAYVPQTVFLMDDTIRNNILFGIDNISDDYIWEVIEKAQLKEFIETLPEGLDTVVGERGIKFSGGQRQRVAIARALINNPQILVLDEATSALDNETEDAVMKAIEALKGKITLVIVAHRLTTIRKCDYVYEIKNGRATIKENVY